ncbi:hypothetical protein BST81_13815 [Leptolyngbya sp. 'hensonii']|uniref:hypothetical protein n=1 Tax=Leptolyngbya sp. 'hensonii' TaxID=1922337 RepID=UPI00094F7000|nr:hypothetical protein [Leptolyngbya sp. 'hensonii']OLP18097.1 hypothetical protein BST81_13815 [Leptolyngbya sp. 'hensonii']
MKIADRLVRGDRVFGLLVEVVVTGFTLVGTGRSPGQATVLVIRRLGYACEGGGIALAPVLRPNDLKL